MERLEHAEKQTSAGHKYWVETLFHFLLKILNSAHHSQDRTFPPHLISFSSRSQLYDSLCWAQFLVVLLYHFSGSGFCIHSYIWLFCSPAPVKKHSYTFKCLNPGGRSMALNTSGKAPRMGTPIVIVWSQTVARPLFRSTFSLLSHKEGPTEGRSFPSFIF